MRFGRQAPSARRCSDRPAPAGSPDAGLRLLGERAGGAAACRSVPQTEGFCNSEFSRQTSPALRTDIAFVGRRHSSPGLLLRSPWWLTRRSCACRAVCAVQSARSLPLASPCTYRWSAIRCHVSSSSPRQCGLTSCSHSGSVNVLAASLPAEATSCSTQSTPILAWSSIGSARSMLTMAPMLPNSPPAGSPRLGVFCGALTVPLSGLRLSTAVCTHMSISGAHASGSIQEAGPSEISRYMYISSIAGAGKRAEKTRARSSRPLRR